MTKSKDASGHGADAEFAELVNMSARELDDWLKTDESKAVGQKSGGDESTGHRSGRKIVKILGKKKSEHTPDDHAHMAKVVGYIKRHRAQGGPAGDVRDSPWRRSLMNWGHDPLK